MNHKFKDKLISILALLVSTGLALGGAEIILRVKNSDMKNYDVEMWRYAKILKQRSTDPMLGHEHIPSKSAVLQSTLIRLNEWGMRGPSVTPMPAPNVRRILVLGSSITLGWGVAEEKTMTHRLEEKFRQDGRQVEVLNAGIGNYNTERYVTLFLTKLQALHPSDIVVQYFIRDAEKLEAGGGNALLQHSELLVTLLTLKGRLFSAGDQNLLSHYQQVYQPQSEGYIRMIQALKRLSAYAHQRHIRLYLAMTPDVHNLKDYPFGFIHTRMKNLAHETGYTFVDLLPGFKNLSPEQVWAMPGDPHPNALGQQIMADELYPVLKL